MEDRRVGRQQCGGETGEAGSFEPRLMPATKLFFNMYCNCSVSQTKAWTESQVESKEDNFLMKERCVTLDSCIVNM